MIQQCFFFLIEIQWSGALKQPHNSLLLAGIFSSLIIPVNLQADSDTDKMADILLDLSLEELISLDVPDVTSVSKRKQRLMDSPAAVFVITNEDIQRSGVTSIPEALRMVPGMQVARLNGNTWSISTRGFNYIFANKLLVLIDGRTVYSPLFSGVNWDVQDTMLEDIARIEVIRGPGAALWGANAVNGVINIITKHSADTQGGLLSTGLGSEEKAFAAYRYGGELGDDGYYRAFFKTFNRDGLANSDGSDANDDWHMKRAGFKSNWLTDIGSEVSIQGELYQGSTSPPLRLFNQSQPTMGEPDHYIYKDRDQRGGNISSSWNHSSFNNHNYLLRATYDNYRNFDYRITEKRDSLDLEYQHGFQPWEEHNLVWGLGYRVTWYEVLGSDYMYLMGDSNHQTNQLYSAFFQDDISLNDKWSLSVSSRLEHNDFTGYEIQPNARLTWKPTETQTFWSAISRAVKTPSISETDLQTQGVTFSYQNNQNYMIPIAGSQNLESEKLIAFELGYREVFSERFRIDSTIFLNHYKDIISYVGTTTCPDGSIFTGDCTPGDPFIEIPTVLSNDMKARSYGFELIADWQVKPWWKLQLTYSWFDIDAEPQKESDAFLVQNEITIEDLSASQSANLRSSLNLPNQWYVDLWIRHMGELKNAQQIANSLDKHLDSYTSLDVRLSKKFGDDIEISLTGKNLFDKQRLEFSEIFSGLGATEVQESWYLQLRWQH